MQRKGPWSAEQMASHLAASIIPLRLAVATPSGMPLVLSLWFLPDGDQLCCATNRNAYVASLLRRDPRCAFEVASDQPPYRGVRGQGRATLDDAQGLTMLGRLLDRYGVGRTSNLGRTLLDPSRQETAIRITPQAMTSWDFTARMSG